MQIKVVIERKSCIGRISRRIPVALRAPSMRRESETLRNNYTLTLLKNCPVNGDRFIAS